MRIDRLTVRNFRKFADRTFEFPCASGSDSGSFHVLIGENGSGKTTVLDALAVALGVWLVNPPDSGLGDSRRPISTSEIRLESVEQGDRVLFREATGGVSVEAFGWIDGRQVSWTRRIAEGKKSTSNVAPRRALEIIRECYERANRNEPVVLPIIGYYGAGRAWLAFRERKKAQPRSDRMARRWDAFRGCLNERIRISDLTEWFETEAIAAVNRSGRFRPGFEIVRLAILHCIPGADAMHYNGDRKEIVLSINGEAQPFSNLSSGQRMMLALVADIAIKAVTQNNSLVPPDELRPEDRPIPQVLQRTPGVILIDELDVHLHPKWQRQVVENLRTLFPQLQFISTTHSPFIVQSLRAEELINLDGQSVPELGNLSVETIAKGLMGIERPDVGQRYEEMVGVAKSYLQMLDETKRSPAEKLAEYEKQLAAKLAPYADNPAFQAFLEMKHAAKLGTAPASANGHPEGI